MNITEESYIPLVKGSGLGVERDLISGAELGNNVLSLCISISDFDGISFKRNCCTMP